MSLDHEEILENELEDMKEIIEEKEHELEELIAKEKEREARENVIQWLEEKRERKELLNDENRIKELLRHVEHAHRTASITEETYMKAKSIHKELLGKD